MKTRYAVEIARARYHRALGARASCPHLLGLGTTALWVRGHLARIFSVMRRQRTLAWQRAPEQLSS